MTFQQDLESYVESMTCVPGYKTPERRAWAERLFIAGEQAANAVYSAGGYADLEKQSAAEELAIAAVIDADDETFNAAKLAYRTTKRRMLKIYDDAEAARKAAIQEQIRSTL